MPDAELEFYITDNRRAHLKMIQDIVSRLAGFSCRFKQWSVAVVPALLVFLAKPMGADTSAPVYAAIAAVPAVIFWALDGYYLAWERNFRNFYKAAAEPQTRVPLFSLTPPPLGVAAWLRACSSVTVFGVHGGLIAIVLVLDYALGGVFTVAVVGR